MIISVNLRHDRRNPNAGGALLATPGHYRAHTKESRQSQFSLCFIMDYSREAQAPPLRRPVLPSRVRLYLQFNTVNAHVYDIVHVSQPDAAVAK
jgi:hypothetical protein